LFIGEAPGQQEDHTGLPFQGRTGYILNAIFKRAHTPFNFVLTNTVACRPTEMGFRDQLINRPPTAPEQLACRPRLDNMLPLFDFEGVVYLGSSRPSFPLRSLELDNPVNILKMEFKLFAIKRNAQKLENYVTSIQKAKAEDIHRG